MKAEDVKQIEDVLRKTNSSIPSNIVRIDNFEIHHSNFLWAWSEDECNGLKDQIWARSNGEALGRMVKGELVRLKNFGVLKHGGVAVDIGAHNGDSTVPMALLASKTVAFDPSISTYPLLRTNAALNSHLHVDAFNLAVADIDTTIKFEYGFPFECNGGVSGSTYGRTNTRTVDRRAVNLQHFLNSTYGEKFINEIAYIKIDCEGFDSVILKSLVGMIGGMEKKPAIQVEYFQKFMLEDNDRVQRQMELCDGTQRLVDAVATLPGDYGMYCTKQCNTEQDCSSQLDRVDAVRENGKVTNLTKRISNSFAFCDDFMLLPGAV